MSNLELSILFFLQLAVILGVCRGVGWLARKIGQPQVVGEMIAGVFLGPSLFGLLAPGVLTVANKWWALGMPLGDVLHATTAAPADWLLPGEGLGRLEIGAVADLAVLDRVSGRRSFVDPAGVAIEAQTWLEPWATVFGGKVVWRAA